MKITSRVRILLHEFIEVIELRIKNMKYKTYAGGIYYETGMEVENGKIGKAINEHMMGLHHVEILAEGFADFIQCLSPSDECLSAYIKHCADLDKFRRWQAERKK